MTYPLIFHHNCLAIDIPALGKPFSVNFNPARYLVQKTALKNELLAKAVGIKKNYFPSICDITAGFGQDAYLLYCLGCKVSLVERSPIIAALLEDGLKRAGCSMDLYIGEAKEYLHQLLSAHQLPEVIYFDPIFPEKNKTALSQKSARILRLIAGKNDDALDVFTLARQAAQKRVVVKRALHAPCITETSKPDISFKGKSIRFDVYFS